MTLAAAKQYTGENMSEPVDSGMVRTQVYEWLDVLNDPSSALHHSFYTVHGVTDAPLIPARHPFAGGTVLVANETEHAVRLGNAHYNTGTFKRRGALMAGLIAAQENPDLEGFVTASAGNHALGVAAVAAALGKRADIHCRTDISVAKSQKLEREFGAHLHPYYATIEDAMTAARNISRYTKPNGSRPLAFIHPFDQPEVIAGQATIGLHIAKQIAAKHRSGEISRDVEVEINANVGGGGLLVGVALAIAWAKERKLLDGNVTVVGAQMERCNALERGLAKLARGEEPVDLFRKGELDASCDGTAVQEAGRIALALASNTDLVKHVRSVSKAGVGAGMRSLTRILHKPVEPAAALGWTLALNDALYQRDSGGSKKVYVPLVTGANVTAERYREYEQAEHKQYERRLSSLPRRSTDPDEFPAATESPRMLAVIGGPTFR